jgi:signal transduction histidine kinase
VPENIEVVSQLDEALPAILADPDQLRQVLGNIILNAVQAMTEGGRLVVKSEAPSPGWVAVSFTDTGVGIPEENLEKIFEPLFTTKAKGIGLGLALVKVLVEGHGGSIEVESPSTEFIPSPALSKACPEPRRRVEGEAEGLRTGKVGKGSTFTVRLPMDSREEE